VKATRKSARAARRPTPAAAAGGVLAPRAAPLVALPASLVIRDVAGVAQQLGAALTGGALVVDASAVTAVDTAGLQLLLAAQRSARARGISARWLGASPTLTRAASALGVARALGLEAGG
jgi:anti-anti-sigma regulatory factor